MTRVRTVSFRERSLCRPKIKLPANRAWWDALLIATATGAGCTAILTEDLTNGGSPHGVRVLNPFAGRAMPPKVRIPLDGEQTTHAPVSAFSTRNPSMARNPFRHDGMRASRDRFDGRRVANALPTIASATTFGMTAAC